MASDATPCRECTLETQPLAKLKAKYVQVVRKIKRIIERIIESKKLEIEDLLFTLNTADQKKCTVFSTDDVFSKITTINQLFIRINDYCTIYDYELLQVFLDSIDECDEAVKLLENFTKERNTSVLKELDLMSEIKDRPKIPMDGTYILKVKYTGDKESTLSTKEMVQRIVYEAFKLQKPSIIFMGLEEGCIAFIYQISAAVKAYILHYKITPDGLALLASHDIKCLIVDGTEIPTPLEFKIQVSTYIHMLVYYTQYCSESL